MISKLLYLVAACATVVAGSSSPGIVPFAAVKKPLSNIDLLVPIVVDSNRAINDRKIFKYTKNPNANADARPRVSLNNLASVEFSLDDLRQNDPVFVLSRFQDHSHISKKDLSPPKHKIHSRNKAAKYRFEEKPINDNTEKLVPNKHNKKNPMPVELTDSNSIIQTCLQYVQNQPRVGGRKEAAMEVIRYLCEELFDSFGDRKSDQPSFGNDVGTRVSRNDAQDTILEYDECVGCCSELFHLLDSYMESDSPVDKTRSADRGNRVIRNSPEASAPREWLGPVGGRRYWVVMNHEYPENRMKQYVSIEKNSLLVV